MPTLHAAHTAVRPTPEEHELLAQVWSRLPEGIIVCSVLRDNRNVIQDVEIVAANPAALRIMNKPHLVGMLLSSLFPEWQENGLFTHVCTVVASGMPQTSLVALPSQPALRISLVPFDDGLLCTLTQTTDAIPQEASPRTVHHGHHPDYHHGHRQLSASETASNLLQEHEQLVSALHTVAQRYGIVYQTPQANSSDTAQQAYLAVVQQLRKRFDAIFNNTFQFTYLISTDGTLLEINQTALNFAGVQAVSVLGKPITSMAWWGDSPEAIARLQAALFRTSGGEFVRYTTEFVSFEGGKVMVDFSLKPIFNEFGDIDFVVAEGRDITAMKRMESERDKERQLADSLQKLNELKNEFVSNVSHELRTPLASIMGFAQTLLRDPNLPTETAQKFLTIILQDGQRLSRLVEDLLDLSKIESGKIELVKQSTNLVDIAEYAIHLAGAESSAKSLTIAFERPEQPVVATIDRDRVTQVVVNLLDNAVKFTPHGGTITLALKHHSKYTFPHGHSAASVELAVSDTGVGISAHDTAHIFEKFYRVSRKDKQVRGTGLGLAIAKQIIDLHGGDIVVESEVGTGSTFRVVLPVGSGR
jgi:PAS domain S-box-containing protein